MIVNERIAVSGNLIEQCPSLADGTALLLRQRDHADLVILGRSTHEARTLSLCTLEIVESSRELNNSMKRFRVASSWG